MGSAIPVMHYTGMAAARFTPSSILPDTAHAVTTSTLGITGVSAVTATGFGSCGSDLDFDRRFSLERVEAESRFRGLLEAAPDAMVVVDRDGKIVLVNVQTEKLFGYGRDELLGQGIEMLMPGAFAACTWTSTGLFCFEPRTRAMGAEQELFGIAQERPRVCRRD